MLPKVIIKIGKTELIAERIFALIKRVELRDCNKFVFDLPTELAKEIKQANKFEYLKDKINNFVTDKTDKKLEKNIITLRKMWEDKSELYFSNIKKYFGEDIYYDTFVGYATNLMVGNYGEKNDFIIRLRDSDFNQAFYTIMEEILHIIYWGLWRKLFGTKEKEPWLLEKKDNLLSNWEISEILPEYIFNFKGPSGREKSYNWIPEAKKILDPLWAEKNDLIDFILKAHKLKKQMLK